MPRLFCLATLLLAALLAGCASSYTTPGGPAPLDSLGLTPQAKAALTDAAVRDALHKQPVASFPATIAIARVQAADYTTYDHGRYTPHSAYSVITVRDVEKDDDLAQLARLPQVANIVTMKRILLDQNLTSDLELRTAAAKLHANMILFYTFDTAFQTENRVRPLGVITLGLFPTKNAKVTSTASAVLMDVANGYIYTVVEATSKDHQLANAWSSQQAMDDVRKRTEREAFENLLAQFKTEWPNTIAQYANRTSASSK